MKNLGSDRKKKANLIKSSDELNVQFSFVKKTIQEIVDDFVEKTNQSLMGMRQIDDEDQTRKKNIEAVPCELAHIEADLNAGKIKIIELKIIFVKKFKSGNFIDKHL